jgi:2-hydroxychromene-2-carboxylate isomerase
MTVHRLRRSVPDCFETIDFIPYWDPDDVTSAMLKARGGEFHYSQMSKAKHLYILQDTKRLAGRLGLAMAWPVDVNPWWEVPHLAWLAARRMDAGPQMYDVLTAARWERGEDICHVERVGELAEGIGLGRAIAEAVHDQSIREEAVECLVDAWQDDVFGVPYFRAGFHRFWGLDRLDDFLACFRGDARSKQPEPVPAAVAAVGAYDADSPGGCG